MASREIVISLRLSEGSTREQFRALKGALIDVNQEITTNNKALRDNAKAQKALADEIKTAGVATEAQSVRERQLAQERAELKLQSANLASSQASLSAQFREVKNDVAGLTDAHLRFRDKMAQATLEALKQQGVLGQLGARMDFLVTEQDKLNKELSQGIITEEKYRIETERVGNELRDLGTRTTELNGKIDKLASEFKQGKITAEQFRASVSEINTSVQNVGGAVSKGVSDLKSFALGFVGVVAVAQGAITAIRSVSRTIADFDQQLANIRALGQEYAASIDRIAKAAIELGPKLGVAPVEALKGFEELAKAGLTTEQILSGALQSALTLSAAGMVEVGQAAETTAATLTQFNLRGEEAGHVTDLLAKGANIAQGNVTDFADALNQTGLVASQFGLSVDETVGGLTAFAKAGLIGSDAGTSFRQALLRLQNPTEKAQDVMAKYGITVTNAQGEFLSLAEIAGQLQDKFKGLTEEQRGAALATIFGQDAIRVANILYREGAAGIQRYTDEVNDSGFANDVAKTKLDSVSGSISKLSASWDAAVVKFDEGNGVLSRSFRTVIEAATEFVDILAGNNEVKNFYNELEDITKRSGLSTKSFFNSAADDAEATINGMLTLFKNVEKEIGKLPPIEVKGRFEERQFFAELDIEKTRKEIEDGTIAPKLGEAKIKAIQILLDEKINPAIQKQQELIDKIANNTEDLGAAEQRLNLEYRKALAERKNINSADEAAIKASDQLIANIKQRAVELGVTLTETANVTSGVEGKVKNVSGSVADLNDQIEKLRIAQEQSTSSEQFATYQTQIDKLSQSVDLLTGKLSQDLVDAANTVPQVLSGVLTQAPLQGAPQEGTPPVFENDLFQTQLEAQQAFQFSSLESLIEYYDTRRLLGQQLTDDEINIFRSAQAAQQEIQLAQIEGAGLFGSAIKQLAKDQSDAAKIGLAIEKAAAVATVVIQLQREIAAINAKYAPIPGGGIIASAESTAAGIRAGVSIATILAQTIAGFEVGGYTSKGPKHKPAGIVHAGEWVAPKHMVEDPFYGRIIDFLEGQRIRRRGMSNIGIGRAAGGDPIRGTALVNLRTNPTTGVTSQRWNDLQAMAIQAVAQQREMVVRVTDINKVQNSVRVADNLATA